MARGGADKAPINHLGLPLPRWSLLQLPPASAEPCLPDPWTHISLEGVSVGKGLGPAHPRQTKAWGEAVSAQGHPRVKCWLRPGLCPGGRGIREWAGAQPLAQRLPRSLSSQFLQG